MTVQEGESAGMLFGIFTQLLIPCCEILKFDHSVLHSHFLIFRNVPLFASFFRRIDYPISQRLSDCAAGYWVNPLFYNHITPIGVLDSAKSLF